MSVYPYSYKYVCFSVRRSLCPSSNIRLFPFSFRSCFSTSSTRPSSCPSIHSSLPFFLSSFQQTVFSVLVYPSVYFSVFFCLFVLLSLNSTSSSVFVLFLSLSLCPFICLSLLLVDRSFCSVFCPVRQFLSVVSSSICP